MKIGRTSEMVAAGHPDKVADIISDSVLDLVLSKNPDGRCSVETLVCTDEVILRGEHGGVDLTKEEVESTVRSAVKRIGYIDIPGFSFDTLEVNNKIVKQSSDISMGVVGNEGKVTGAGDQGIMLGYSTNETLAGLPVQFFIVQELMKIHNQFEERRNDFGIRPDAKCQFTLTPDNKNTLVFSVSHDEGVDVNPYVNTIIDLACDNHPELEFYFENVTKLINPTGRFVACGPSADTGLTGRKIVCDSYGGVCPVGGGAFSSKDPSKVDRSAAYMARFLANKLVDHYKIDYPRENNINPIYATVMLSYAIGVSEPTSIEIKSNFLSDLQVKQWVDNFFKLYDLTPQGIIEFLKLKEINYELTAWNGHFNRLFAAENRSFTWEL